MSSVYIGMYLSYHLVDQMVNHMAQRKQLHGLYDLVRTNRLTRGGNVYLSRDILYSIIERDVTTVYIFISALSYSAVIMEISRCTRSLWQVYQHEQLHVTAHEAILI
jgi:hypothetical protein